MADDAGRCDDPTCYCCHPENQHDCPVPTPDDHRRAVNGTQVTCPECGRTWVCRAGETPYRWPESVPVPAQWWEACR